MDIRPPDDPRSIAYPDLGRRSAVYGFVALAGIAVARMLAGAGWLPLAALRGLVFLAVAAYPPALVIGWARARRTGAEEPVAAGARTRMPGWAWGGLGVGALLAAAWIGLHGPGDARPDEDHSASVPEPYVVVLPLLDLDRRADRTFADGFTDLIAEGLASVEGVEVRGRVSAATYVDVNRDAAVVGARLGGAAVVDGTVRRTSGRLRLSIRLLNTADETPVWTFSADTTLDGLYGLREQVVKGVTAALGGAVDDYTLRLLERRRTSPAALNLYMLGRYRWAARTDGDLAEAMSYYQMAIEADSNFTAAWTALAEGYATLPRFTRFAPNAAREYGAAAARTALRLDPDAAAAHTALGEILYAYERDWDGARAHLERAMELDPGDAAPRDRLCELELVRGEPAAAAEACRGARQRDPLAYRQGWLTAQIARVSGDVAGSLRQLDSLVVAYPDFEPLSGERAITRLLLTGIESARTDLADWFELLARQSLADSLAATLSNADAGGGPGPRVRAALARVADDLGPDPVQLAALMAFFGEPDAAARLVLEALERRTPTTLGLGVLPEFRVLRAREDVAGALEAAGLPVS